MVSTNILKDIQCINIKQILLVEPAVCKTFKTTDYDDDCCENFQEEETDQISTLNQEPPTACTGLDSKGDNPCDTGSEINQIAALGKNSFTQIVETVDAELLFFK